MANNCVCVSCLVMSDSLRPHGIYIACLAPLAWNLFMEFSRKEYWNGLPFPSPKDLP